MQKMRLENSSIIRMVTSQVILALKRGCSRQRQWRKCSSMQCSKEDHFFNLTPLGTPVGKTLNLTIQEQSVVGLSNLVLDMQSGLFNCQKKDGANSMW